MKKFLKGFTLIELLIVIVIIGILAVAFLPTAINAPKRARDAARKANLNSLVTAIEALALDTNGTYPSTGCLDNNTAVGAIYLKSYLGGAGVPTDPGKKESSGACRAGTPDNAGKYSFKNLNNVCYLIATAVEDTKNGNYDSDPSSGITTCTPTTNYPVSSGGYYVLLRTI